MSRKKSQRISDRETYKRRLGHLLANPPSSKIDGPEAFELDGHFAKYACVLVSGYLEASVKEILHSYAVLKSESRVSFYIDKTWPNSMNMNSKNIIEMVGRFDQDWEQEIREWLGTGDQSNGSVINGIVKNRNNIAHGSEFKTTGVSISSVRSQFGTAKGLIAKLETMICPPDRTS